MTEQEYFEAVARVAAASPAHPLLRTLQRGHSTINEIYLAAALKSVEAAAMAEEATETADVFDANDDPADPELVKMRVEMRRLFFERNSLSNRFRDCRSNAERADISAQIEVVQRNIGRQMRRIRHWKLAGQLPDGDDGRHYVPRDGLELARLQASLRASISRKKGEVADLQSLDLSENERGQRKLESCLKKLEDLEMHLAEVRKVIQNL